MGPHPPEFTSLLPNPMFGGSGRSDPPSFDFDREAGEFAENNFIANVLSQYGGREEEDDHREGPEFD